MSPSSLSEKLAPWEQGYARNCSSRDGVSGRTPGDDLCDRSRSRFGGEQPQCTGDVRVCGIVREAVLHEGGRRKPRPGEVGGVTESVASYVSRTTRTAREIIELSEAVGAYRLANLGRNVLEGANGYDIDITTEFGTGALWNFVRDAKRALFSGFAYLVGEARDFGLDEGRIAARCAAVADDHSTMLQADWVTADSDLVAVLNSGVEDVVASVTDELDTFFQRISAEHANVAEFATKTATGSARPCEMGTGPMRSKHKPKAGKHNGQSGPRGTRHS